MSFRLISLLFKIGHVFGITPWSLQVPKISLLKKFYYVLIFVLIMYGFISRGVVQLRSHSTQLILLYVINNIALAGQNSAFLLRSLTKRKSWISFLRNLETTAELTHVRTRTTAKNFFCCGFLFVTVLHLLTMTLTVFALPQFRSSVWKEFYADYFLTLFNFHNQFLSCVLVNMIRTRYKNLRKMVQVHFERRRKLHLESLKKIQYTVRSLKVTVDGYNDLFGWINLFHICNALARLVSLTEYGLARLTQLELLKFNVLNVLCLIWIVVDVGRYQNYVEVLLVFFRLEP